MNPCTCKLRGHVGRNVFGFAAFVLSDIPSDAKQPHFHCRNKSGISECSAPSTQTTRLQSSNMIEIRTAIPRMPEFSYIIPHIINFQLHRLLIHLSIFFLSFCFSDIILAQLFFILTWGQVVYLNIHSFIHLAVCLTTGPKPLQIELST